MGSTVSHRQHEATITPTHSHSLGGGHNHFSPSVGHWPRAAAGGARSILAVTFIRVSQPAPGTVRGFVRPEGDLRAYVPMGTEWDVVEADTRRVVGYCVTNDKETHGRSEG